MKTFKDFLVESSAPSKGKVKKDVARAKELLDRSQEYVDDLKKHAQEQKGSNDSLYRALLNGIKNAERQHKELSSEYNKMISDIKKNLPDIAKELRL